MSLFNKLDNYYNSRKTSEVILMVALVAILVGYLLYTIITPIASDYRLSEENKNSNLRTEIEDGKNYLNSITVDGDRDYYVKDLNKKLVNKRMQLNQLRAKMVKLDGSIKDFKTLLYTKDNWSKFLHTITSKAERNNLSLHSISNKHFDQNQTFGKVLDIKIEVQGDYNKILNFMNQLEQTDLVANISNVNLLATDSKPKAKIELSVWGIKP